MQNAQAFYSPARLWWYYKKNQRLFNKSDVLNIKTAQTAGVYWISSTFLLVTYL